MNRLSITVLLIVVLSIDVFAQKNFTDRIKFATIDKATELLSQEDEFTRSWSQFDIDSRLHKKNSTRAQLFDYIVEQAGEWTPAEKKKIISIFKDLDEQIAKQELKISIEGEIFLIKTTGNEEGGASGYTRANYIVLKDDVISQSKNGLKQTLAHELFHIATRNNPDFRKEMYKIIGFEITAEIEYPIELKPFRITNPDAPRTDSYINLKVNNKEIEGMMILYSTRDYTGGDFFQYLNIGFLSLEGDSVKRAEFEANKPSVYPIKQVTGFFEQVGKNTQYIIDPEEILADNFAFAILNKKGLPNQEIVNKIKEKLKR